MLFWVKVGLAAMGAIFLSVGFGLGISNVRFASGAKRTDGVVVDLVWRSGGKGRPSAAPVVSYEVDGKAYQFTSGTASRPPSYDVGEKVGVLYDPEDPSDAKLDGFWELYMLPFIFGLLGLADSAAVAIWVGIERRKRQRIERALGEGRRVMANVIAVDLNHSVRFNHRHPWRITAEHEGRRFVSPNLWTDPTPHYPVGSEVPVFVVAGEPDVYAFKLEKMADEAW